MITYRASYSMITGASLGLGRVLALEWAIRGMDLVFMALPDEGLDQLKSRINSLYPVEPKISPYGCVMGM
jgi:short-subunit dehydrogenase